MILDSSAIIAVLLQEPGYQRLVAAMASAEVLSVGAPTLAETGLVLISRLGPTATEVLLRMLTDLDVNVKPFDAHHWPVAADAFDRFGKGRHPAGLNFGDCLAYAIARTADQPLLCVGDDFRQTDLTLVLSTIS